MSSNRCYGAEYPRFSNPETAEVVRIIVDRQNYEAILEDTTLDLKLSKGGIAGVFEFIR